MDQQMAEFRPTGSMPQGYQELLNAARQQLVRRPDGTLAPAPQQGTATTINEIYAGSGMRPATAGSPPQGTKRNRGSTPAADNTLAEPWGGAVDRVAVRQLTPAELNARDKIKNVPVQVAAKPASTINAVDPLDASRLGLTAGPAVTAAQRAIAEVLFQPGMMGRGQPGMVFEATQPPTAAPAGDPWRGLRAGGQVQPRQGILTGNAPRPGATGLFGLILRQQQQKQPPVRGYNGQTTVTSNDLRPTHSSIFSENALLPASMNNRRWAGDGY